MLNKVSRKLANLIIARGVIDECDREEYIYGYEVQLSRLFLFFVVAILAIFTKTVVASCVFMVSFLFIKSRVPCYHCTVYRNCFMLSLSLYVSFILQYLFIGPFEIGYFLLVWSLGACCISVTKMLLNWQSLKKPTQFLQKNKPLLLLTGGIIILCLFSVYIVAFRLVLPVIYAAFMVSILSVQPKEVIE